MGIPHTRLKNEVNTDDILQNYKTKSKNKNSGEKFITTQIIIIFNTFSYSNSAWEQEGH